MNLYVPMSRRACSPPKPPRPLQVLAWVRGSLRCRSALRLPLALQRKRHAATRAIAGTCNVQFSAQESSRWDGRGGSMEWRKNKCARAHTHPLPLQIRFVGFFAVLCCGTAFFPPLLSLSVVRGGPPRCSPERSTANLYCAC